MNETALPLVSIVTVCLNSEQYLESAIQSVLNQTYPNIEYIIIDGGSQDGTLDIIRKYDKDNIWWISEPDKGIYDAMNKGISVCRGELIGILNSDDWYEKDTVQTIVEESLRAPECEVFHGNLMKLTVDCRPKCFCRPSLEWKRIWFEMVINHPTCFVRKTTYDRFGKFSIKYRIASDYEFILRLYVNGVKMKYIDKVLANMRIGGISHSEHERVWLETRDIAVEYGLSPFKAYLCWFYRTIKRRIRDFLIKYRMGFLVSLRKKILGIPD